MISPPATARPILHLAPGHWAGHMRIFHRECLTLAGSGYTVELAAHERASEPLNGAVKIHSLGTYPKPTLAWGLNKRLKRCRAAYELACRSGAALFHYHSPEFIPWAVRLRGRRGVPVVFDCMEDFEGYARQRRGIPDWLRGALAFGVRRFLATAAHRCDAVVVADEGTARFFRQEAKRVVVIHNYPDLDLFPDVESGGGDGPQYDLVYHGSIPRYHLEGCLAIDEALSRRGYQATWRLLGNMPDVEWFLIELGKRGIAQRFHIGGLVPHDQVAREVRKARIGIIPLPDLPKFRNNIPQKLFEFMALKMPVVLSDLPPSRPFVADRACGFMVPPGDYDAYAESILTLVKDPGLCRKMGAEGRTRVEAEYNWGKESRKLLALYAELLQSA